MFRMKALARIFLGGLRGDSTPGPGLPWLRLLTENDPLYTKRAYTDPMGDRRADQETSIEPEGLYLTTACSGCGHSSHVIVSYGEVMAIACGVSPSGDTVWKNYGERFVPEVECNVCLTNEKHSLLHVELDGPAARATLLTALNAGHIPLLSTLRALAGGIVLRVLDPAQETPPEPFDPEAEFHARTGWRSPYSAGSPVSPFDPAEPPVSVDWPHDAPPEAPPPDDEEEDPSREDA